MAYNPFNIFRRNQKAHLRGRHRVHHVHVHPLERGRRRGRLLRLAPALARVQGQEGRRRSARSTASKIYDGELTRAEELRYQRVMANRFMSLAAGADHRHALDSTSNEQLTALSPEARQLMDSVRQRRCRCSGRLSNPHVRAAARRSSASLLQQMRAGRADRSTRPTPRAAEDKEVARATDSRSCSLQQTCGGGGGEHYFRNAPNRTQRDLVEFMLWQKKADQLGIRFTTDDVKKLIAERVLRLLPLRRRRSVQKAHAAEHAGLHDGRRA